MPAQPRDDETFGDDMHYTSDATRSPEGNKGRLLAMQSPIFRHIMLGGLGLLVTLIRSIHYAAGPLYHGTPLHNHDMIGMTRE